MSNFVTIDPASLETVTGGATGEVGVKLPGGSGNVKFDTATPANPQAKDANPYIRCLDLVGKQAGMMESADNVAKRQQDLCGPLLNKQ
ncbi:MAG: hypothetical protein R3B06_10630 [Kofleriaceae bacterium]